VQPFCIIPSSSFGEEDPMLKAIYVVCAILVDRHLEKNPQPKISTHAGIMISIKPVSSNAFSSVRDNLDPDSNLTEESDLHLEKYPQPKISTDAGILISIKPLSSSTA
jgi:hypothetical protein